MSTTKAGFTLLELIVVLAILFVFFSLLGSAIQRVRNNASRLSCLNNLKQIGLALHQYHATHNHFPPGCSYSNGTDPMPHVSWMARLLPYLEQDQLWNSINVAFQQSSFFQNAPHKAILSKQQPIFSCPADGRVFQPWDFGNLRVGLTSYQGVSGLDRSSFDGILFLDSQVRMLDVRDGLSTTIIVGERPPSADARLGWWYAGWGQARDGSADLHIGVQELNIVPRYELCGPGPFSFSQGSPTNNCDVFHFWSLHPGGANFLFADGSSRFLRYDSNTVLRALGTRDSNDVIGANY